MTRRPCPSDVSDEEWAFLAPGEADYHHTCRRPARAHKRLPATVFGMHVATFDCLVLPNCSA